MNEIFQAISSIGFPIVMCLIMWNTCNKEIKNLTIAVEALTLVVNKNNNVLQEVKN